MEILPPQTFPRVYGGVLAVTRTDHERDWSRSAAIVTCDGHAHLAAPISSTRTPNPGSVTETTKESGGHQPAVFTGVFWPLPMRLRMGLLVLGIGVFRDWKKSIAKVQGDHSQVEL